MRIKECTFLNNRHKGSEDIYSTDPYSSLDSHVHVAINPPRFPPWVLQNPEGLTALQAVAHQSHRVIGRIWKAGITVEDATLKNIFQLELFPKISE